MADDLSTEVNDTYTRERLRFIELKRRALARAACEYEEAKLIADARRKALEAAQLAYNAAGEQQDPPLLDVNADPLGWRDVSIGELGLSDNIIEAMSDKGVETLGHLHDWLADGRNALTDLRGVGAGKAEHITNVLERFWASHPEYTQPEGGEDEDA